MKCYLLRILSVVLSIIFASSALAENVEDNVVWIRPVKETTTYQHDGRTYVLFEGSYVQVRGENNGDIIVGKDTLQTDNKVNGKYLTDKTKKKTIELDCLRKVQTLKDSVKIINDTILYFAFDGIQGNGKLNMYLIPGTISDSFDGKVYKELSFNSNDSIFMSQIKGLNTEFQIVLIPQDDDIVATYIKVSEINKIRVKLPILQVGEKDVSDFWGSNLFWTIVAILVILIIGVLSFLKYKEHNANILPFEEYQKMASKLLKEIENSINFLKEDIKETENKNSLISELESCKDKTTKFTEILNSGNTSDPVYSDTTDIKYVFNTTIHHVKEIRKIKDSEKVTELEEKIKNDNLEIGKILDNHTLNAQDSIKEDVNGTSLVYDNSNKRIGDSNSEIIECNGKKGDKSSNQDSIDVLQEEVERLTRDCAKLEANIKELSAANKQLERDKILMEQEKQKTEENLKKANQSLQDEKASRKDVIDKKVKEKETEFKQKLEKAKKTAENSINEFKISAQRKVDAANQRADKVEEKSKTIKKELEIEFDKERVKTAKEKETLNISLSETRLQLTKANNELDKTSKALVASNRKVENLTIETESFNRYLSGVTDSQAYCQAIKSLVDLSREIEHSAMNLLKSSLDDKYFVYKALALYSSKLNGINLANFYTDVEMISATGFVIKGTPLATYDSSLPKKELENLTKTYFFTTYLKTYIDALVVLNESIIGLQFLLDDFTHAQAMEFIEYRKKLEVISRKLGIEILTVKVYDSVGANIDLLATEIDAGYSKHGAILEIENCKVSLIGGAQDKSRIIVKIQK